MLWLHRNKQQRYYYRYASHLPRCQLLHALERAQANTTNSTSMGLRTRSTSRRRQILSFSDMQACARRSRSITRCRAERTQTINRLDEARSQSCDDMFSLA